MLHGRSASGLCLITPPLSVQHDFAGTIKSCLILRLQHQLQFFFLSPSIPTFPPIRDCLFDVQTFWNIYRESLHLITNVSREAEAPPTANLCKIPFLPQRSSCPATFFKARRETVFWGDALWRSYTCIILCRRWYGLLEHSLSSPITDRIRLSNVSDARELSILLPKSR